MEHLLDFVIDFGFIWLLGVRLDASVKFFNGVMMKSASVARW